MRYAKLNINCPISFTLAVGLLFTLGVAAGFADTFESGTQTLGFNKAVPESIKNLKSSEFHTTGDQVTVEYDLNHFILESEFGELSVISNQQLHQTVLEFAAIAEIAKISKAGAIGDSVVEMGKATVDSTVQIIKDPLKTIRNIPGGFARMFKSTKEDIAKARRLSDGEISTMDAINPGYEAAKRNLCKELGVDPYSRNPLLQAELKRVGVVMSYGAYSSEKMKEALSDADARAALNSFDKLWNFKPHEIRDEIKIELPELGVDAKLVEALVNNPAYTLTELFILSESLMSIGALPGVDKFVEVASLAQSVYDALFYVDIAEFFAGYHKENPLKAYSIIGLVPVAVKTDNSLVVYTASDQVTWTEGLSNEWGEISPRLANEYSSLEVITYGLFSPMSTEKLGLLGWKLSSLSRYGP
jgi:hypothetical protein